MKRVIPWIAVAAVLIVGGVISGRGDSGSGHTAKREAWAAYERGRDHLMALQLHDAEVNLRRAVELDPNFALAHADLAFVLFRAGQDDTAERERALADSLAALIPRDLERLQVQVRLSMASKSRFFPAADSLLAAGVARDPNEIIFLVAQADRATYDDQPAEEERIWRRILEVNPNYAEAYNRLGYLYFNQGRYEEAQAAMRKYAFVAPELANPHDSLGEVLRTVGAYEDAVAEFKRALAKQPDFLWSQLNIGIVYLERGEVDAALQLFEQMRSVLQGTAWDRRIAIQTLTLLAAHDLNEDLARESTLFLQKFPHERETPFVRIGRLAYSGNEAACLALLDSTLADARAKPDYSRSVAARRSVDEYEASTRGMVAAAAGNPAEAVVHFQRAVEIGKDGPPHQLIDDRYRLAVNLHAAGQDDQALRQVDLILAINPRRAEALALAAEVNLGRQDRAAALRYLEALERTLSQADDDFPALVRARALRQAFKAASAG